MKKIQSELPVFYETAHAEFASALEMLAACKKTNSPKQALGYFMHAKDEYRHAKCFFKMLSVRGKRVSIKKARDQKINISQSNRLSKRMCASIHGRVSSSW